MATKKQKKKKKKVTGASRSTYAKGKKLETSATGKPEGKARAAKPDSGKPAREREESADRPGQWNVVRRGTLEMKVFQVLLAILALGALLQYPLWTDVANEQYQELKRQYPAVLKEWAEEYRTDEKPEGYSKEKPLEPKKPAFGDFLLYQALILILQGALFVFLGINISRRTELGTPILDRALSGEGRLSDAWDLLKNAVPWGMAALAVLLLSAFTGEALGFSGKAQIQESAAWKNSLYFINLAINNQMLFVFLLVSIFVWLFTRYAGRLKVEPHWAGIVTASLLSFGYFYMILGSAGEKVLVSLVGSFFFALSLVGMMGYLYWKKGIEYSLLAGMITLGLYPLVASLIIK